MENQYSRTELLVGKDGIEKIKNAKVAVFGLGGVGSYAVEALARVGIGHLVLIDYDKYDIILCMDTNNMRNIKRIIPIDPEKKIHKLMDFAYGGDVADPWYTGDFTTTYKDVTAGCSGLLEYLKENYL